MNRIQISIIFILGLIFIPNVIFSFDFELTPLYLNFYGSISCGENVIVYGSNGSYLLSSDEGKTWKQYSLLSGGTILDMAIYDNNLYAVFEEGIVAVSSDCGSSWNTKKIELDSAEFLFSIAAKKNAIYIRSNQGIYWLNNDLEVQKVLKHPLLNLDSLWPYQRIFEGKVDNFKVINFRYRDLWITNIWSDIDAVERFKLYSFKDKLITICLLHKYGNFFDSDFLVVIDTTLSALDTVNTDRGNFYVRKSDVDTDSVYYVTSHRIWNLQEYKDSLLITCDGVLFITDSISGSWRLFYPVSSTKIFYHSISNFRYFVNRDNLFFVSKRETYKTKNLVYGRCGYDYLFKKFVDLNGKFSFVDIAPEFNDSTIAPVRLMLWYPDSNKYDEYVFNASYYLLLSKLTIKDDSLIFIPGPFKFILKLNTNSKSWEVISCNTGQPEIILNDSTFVFLNRNSYFNNPSTSFDGGLTFKPTLFGKNITKRFNPNDTLNPYTWDTITYFQAYKETWVFHMDYTGRGFWIGGGLWDPFDTTNFGYTLDFGKFFKFDSTLKFPRKPYYYPQKFTEDYPGRDSPNFPGYNYPNYPPIQVNKVGDKYIFPLCDYSRFIHLRRSSIIFLDTNFKEYQVLYLPVYKENWVADLLQLLALDDKHFILLYRSVDTLTSTASIEGNIRFEIRESFDSGKTDSLIARIDGKYSLDLKQYYVHNRDSIFFIVKSEYYPTRLFLYDVKRKVLKKLFESEDENVDFLLMVISDHFYLVGRGLFLENADRSDLTQWREGEWDYGKPNFESVIFRGNVAIAGLSDSLRPFNYYKITLKKQEPSVVKEPTVEKRYYTTHFWASEPYPQPAKVRVKAHVAWDGSFDLREAIDGVYDTMGRKVEGKERIRVDARSTSSGELEWECSGVPAGIYFILIRWGGGSETVPVVVE